MSSLPADTTAGPSIYEIIAFGLERATNGVVGTNGADFVTPLVMNPTDPYLDVLPSFAYSMPVQVLVLGTSVTLLCVLLVLLLFTVRYHLPLSKVNYWLQVGAVTISLMNTIAQIHIMMSKLMARPRVWPYMFDYIEVSLPPRDWSQAALAAWLTLQGLNTLSVHATHIQFLTLLFPSALEGRLILVLLGPLALVSSFLSFGRLSDSDTAEDLGDAIQNTANGSLTLLYTLAIFIWGFFLNRSRAWRTDGGTATFGILALFLGVSGTALNYYEVKEDRLRWLGGVVNCILLWQTWCSLWWWVGSGMWSGEAEEVGKERDKKKAKQVAKAEKRRVRDEARGVTSGEGEGSGRFSLRRRNTTRSTRAEDGEEIELQNMATTTSRPNPTPPLRQTRTRSSPDSTSSSSTPASRGFFSPVLDWIYPFISRIAVEHNEAAVARAALPPGLQEDVRRGWGLRALMLRRRRERGELAAEMGNGSLEAAGETEAGERRAGFVVDGGAQLEDDEERWEDDTSEEVPTHPRRDPSSVDYAGRGMEGQSQWWWRGVVGKWRLKDVSKF